jgi:hypothetical protein
MDGSLMAVTPNYSWPVPVNTDYVKDGAEAIKDLGDAIDATVFGLPAPASGLTLVSATTIGTAVSSVSVNDVFSATYDNYRILLTSTGSPAAELRLRYRVSGADNTVANYDNQNLYASATTITAARTSLQTSTTVGSTGNNFQTPFAVDIFNPFIAKTTLHMSNNSQNGDVLFFVGGRFSPTTSFTGFTIFPASGTITGGDIRVYGYQN